MKKQESETSKAARVMGKKGGSKGGKTSSSHLTAKQRKRRAKHAADVRWGNALPGLTFTNRKRKLEK